MKGGAVAPAHVPWAAPWHRVRPEDVPLLTKELQRELAPGHVLEGRACVAVGRRQDNDDVLFAVEGAPFEYAVVHLTWASGSERDVACPSTTTFVNLDDWVRRCLQADVAEWRELA